MKTVFIKIIVPEDYQDCHPELIADDFVNNKGNGFDWEVVQELETKKQKE